MRRIAEACWAGVLSMTFLTAGIACAAGDAGDWPQFRGPRGDGKCTETGLLTKWPAGGPKLLWTLTGLGRGYSTVSIADRRILTTGDRGTPSEGESQYIIAFDLNTRKELWATRIGPPWGDGGPRSTPTIDGPLTYVLGTDSDLVCVETATGKLRGTRTLPRISAGK